MWQEIFGTIRGAFEGDVAAQQRAGGWARVLIDQQQQARLQQLVVWLERVQMRSAAKWYPPGIDGACRVVTPASACHATAVGACCCCGRPVCLRHAMISADADLLCASCFGVAKKHTTTFDASACAPGAGKPHDSSADALRQAYKVLGVAPNDEPDVIRKAYKELLRRNHPDGKKSETAKRRAESRFKEIRAAWDTISADRGIL